ncbi:hypothetical protein BDR03DRAFT_938762 [Suillus americanus]|nr:hypothetical protein BDR03DRAFT_938762 [Suillus americanus]
MAGVGGLAEVFAPSVIMLPQPSPFESSSARGTNHAAHALSLLSCHLASCHYDPMISEVTRLEEMYSMSLFLPPPKFIVFVLNFFLQCAYLEALHILFFNTNFHSRIRIARYQELCMDICQIISHTNINT